MDVFVVDMVGMVLAQVDPNGAGAEAAQNAGVQSVWDFARKGGVMMIPIGICSLVAMAVAAERLISLSRSRVIPTGFIDGLKRTIADGHDADKALAYCAANESPIASLCAAAIRRRHHAIDIIERYVADSGAREIFRLRKRMRVLSVIAAISPLMGLTGTIFGMIKAFQTVATSGDALGKTELLATGIYEAMITTAAGLLVAIPALILYHVISARVDRLVAELDETCIEFIDDPDGLAALAKSAPVVEVASTPRAPEPDRARTE
jgi:biopolymer transport protein ExbB